MNTKRTGLFVMAGLTLAAVVFLASSSMIVAQENAPAGKMAASAPGCAMCCSMPAGQMAASMPACAMCKMKMTPESACPKCKTCCMNTCKERMAKMDEAAKALDAARKAIDGGDAKAASADIGRASALLKEMQDSVKACAKAATTAAADGVVNAKCPITGTAIDPAKVPSELTRIYKGRKVGFCCASCPPAWDKLSDADKDAKLQDATK